GVPVLAGGVRSHAAVPAATSRSAPCSRTAGPSAIRAPTARAAGQTGTHRHLIEGVPPMRILRRGLAAAALTVAAAGALLGVTSGAANAASPMTVKLTPYSNEL